MKEIILLTLLWVSPLPFLVKYIFTTLLVIQIIIENYDFFTITNNKDKKKTTKSKSSKK